MAIKSTIILTCAVALASSGAALAQQQANPTPGCAVTPNQLAANRALALSFFAAPSPAARVALIDPSYQQHNPNFVKRAKSEHISDYDEFKQTFLNMGRRGPPPAQAGMPAGNSFEIVTAECDIVTVVHKRYMQDPSAAPGKFYPAFTFDTFRVKNGKLVEHWDDSTIQPPPGPK